MKFFRPKFLTALLFLFFAFNAKAVNDTLTIGQVFDLKVGDSLYYRSYEFFECHPFPGATSTCYQYQPIGGFTVISKQITGDTLTYILQCLTSLAQDTVRLNNLNSSITTYKGPLDQPFICAPFNVYALCDSNAISCSFNSGSIISRMSNAINVGYFESGQTVEFLEKVGLFSSRYSALEYIWMGGSMGIPGGNGIDLVYYKSDSSLWIDSAVYFYNSISSPTPAPTFRLYPNPATDELTITTENQTPADIYIYDMLGNCVLTHKNFSGNMISLKVNHLPPGYYLLKLTDQHGLSSSKGFIIAR